MNARLPWCALVAILLLGVTLSACGTEEPAGDAGLGPEEGDAAAEVVDASPMPEEEEEEESPEAEDEVSDTSPTEPATEEEEESEAPESGLAMGSATCTDAQNDAIDPDGNAAPVTLPEQDLQTVRLDLDEENVRVTIEHYGSIPSDPGLDELGTPDSRYWQVKIASDDTTIVHLEAQQIGEEWFKSAFVMDGLEMLNFSEPVVDGNRLLLSYPRDQLPALEAPITWSAVTEWGLTERFNDYCPDLEGGDDVMLPLPDGAE